MTDIPPEQWGDWLPSTMITELVPDEDHQEWIPLDGGDWFGTNREGIWALSGHMDVMVDNFPDLNDWKIMWIQLTWHESVENAEPALLNFDPAYDTKEIVFETTEPLCGGWMVTIWEVVIEDNPPDESFRIQGDILVDQLVIDTWCMPEPATLALLGFGGLGVLLRRRRK